MKRRDLLALAGAPALPAGAAAAVAGGARPTPWRIHAVTYRGRTDVERGFADYFAARGIPVQITWRDIALDPARLPRLVDEIRRERPDLVHTWGTGVTLGIAGRWDAPDPARYVRDIPVVFSLVAAPVGAGIVPDVHAPGRPVTGVSHVASLAVQLQTMADYRPYRTVGMLHSPNEPNSTAVLNELQALGRSRGIAVLARPFRANASGQPSADGAAELVRQLHAQGAQWLYMPPDSFLSTQARDVVVPAALALGLPAFASTEQLMSAGALLGLVSRYYNVGQFAAFKAEQILSGKVPAARIPVETLTRFSLQIDLAVARRLGLLPPLDMFNYAELVGDARNGSS